MKKYILALAVLALFGAVSVHAEELVCGDNQSKKSVLVTEAVIGTPAVTHTVHHDAITHEITVIDSPQKITYQFVGFFNGDYIKFGNSYYKTEPNHGNFIRVIIPEVSHKVTIIDTPAWDEVVIDVPAVIAQEAVYEDVCVDNPIVPVVPPVATEVVSSSHSSGFMHPCAYVAMFSDMPCPWTEELRLKFALDESFREMILAPWRAVVFGGVTLK